MICVSGVRFSGCCIKLPYRQLPSNHYVCAFIIAYFVILSSMLFGSRMKVGSVIRLRSAPGRNCEIIDINTIPSTTVSTCPTPLQSYRINIPFFSLSSTTVSSSDTGVLVPSLPDLLPVTGTDESVFLLRVEILMSSSSVDLTLRNAQPCHNLFEFKSVVAPATECSRSLGMVGAAAERQWEM